MEETCSIITATRWLTTGNWVALLSNLGLAFYVLSDLF